MSEQKKCRPGANRTARAMTSAGFVRQYDECTTPPLVSQVSPPKTNIVSEAPPDHAAAADDAPALRVRDMRQHGHYRIDSIFIRDGYAAALGPFATAIYNVLCCYADNETQQTRPRQETIARMAGCSERKAGYALADLERRGLIKRTRTHRKNGHRAVDIIDLLHYDNWIKPKIVDEVMKDGRKRRRFVYDDKKPAAGDAKSLPARDAVSLPARDAEQKHLACLKDLSNLEDDAIDLSGNNHQQFSDKTLDVISKFQDFDPEIFWSNDDKTKLETVLNKLNGHTDLALSRALAKFARDRERGDGSYKPGNIPDRAIGYLKAVADNPPKPPKKPASLSSSSDIDAGQREFIKNLKRQESKFEASFRTGADLAKEPTFDPYTGDIIYPDGSRDTGVDEPKTFERLRGLGLHFEDVFSALVRIIRQDFNRSDIAGDRSLRQWCVQQCLDEMYYHGDDLSIMGMAMMRVNGQIDNNDHFSTEAMSRTRQALGEAKIAREYRP